MAARAATWLRDMAVKLKRPLEEFTGVELIAWLDERAAEEE